MVIDQKTEGDVSILGLQGRLVAGVGDVMLRDAMNELLADGSRKILLDLTKVTHVDSSGVGELVASRKISRRFGTSLKLVRSEPGGGVEAVFKISRILPLFSFCDSVEDALVAFANEPLPTIEPDSAVAEP
jgi:anti-sigma B factor antagonist